MARFTAPILSPALGACAQLDHLVIGSGLSETHSVMILGAGIAGLTAARELKNAGIPFRIFEGTQRVGGRCYTLEEFTLSSQRADIGAEWLSTEDAFSLKLCQELKLEVMAMPPSFRQPFFFWPPPQNKKIDSGYLQKKMESLDKKILELISQKSRPDLDAISFGEFINQSRLKIDGQTGLWLRRVIQYEFGVPPRDVSALAVVERFKNSPTGYFRFMEKRIRLRDGMQSLATALYDRVAGVIPGRTVLFGHKLLRIRNRNDLFKMEFQTDDGISEAEANVVICALPFSSLRSVQGLENLNFSSEKLYCVRTLGYGNHGKMVASFKEYPWPSKSSLWTGNFKTQWIWDVSGQKNPHPGFRTILVGQLAGLQGKSIGLTSLPDLEEDLKQISASVPSAENSQIMNWTLNPWSMGSVSFFKPGQVLSFSDTLLRSERKGKFIFAGEHTSPNSMGSVNGAIESGLRAAKEAAKFKDNL